MIDRDGDWLRVVYGTGLETTTERAGVDGGDHAELRVRQWPIELELEPDRTQDHRVRVSIVPSRPGLRWKLYLRELGAGTPERRAWWRVEPGTWQPLAGARPCLAQGRGRLLVDVALRFERGAAGRVRLRFVAEAAD